MLPKMISNGGDFWQQSLPRQGSGKHWGSALARFGATPCSAAGGGKTAPAGRLPRRAPVLGKMIHLRRVVVSALDVANGAVDRAITKILALQRGGKIDEKLVARGNRQRRGRC
jgi:hypothetical protein